MARSVALVALLLASAMGIASAAPCTETSPAVAICADPDLKTFCRLIMEADPDGKASKMLQDPTTRATIFAPTEAAFSKTEDKVADELSLKRFADIFVSNDKKAERLLSNLFIPYVAIGSKAMKNDDKYKSFLGQDLEFDTSILSRSFFVKGEELSVKIIEEDVPAGNSVLHKTDRVQVPDDKLFSGRRMM